MQDESDFLWGMYQEHTAQGRHHEEQRATVTNFIIIVSGGVLAFITDKGLNKDQWFLAVFLIIIGLFGALFSLKQYQKFRFHMKVAKAYRNALEKKIKEDLADIRSTAKKNHEDEFPKLLVKIPLFTLWLSFHLLIVLLGLILLYLVNNINVNPTPPL